MEICLLPVTSVSFGIQGLAHLRILQVKVVLLCVYCFPNQRCASLHTLIVFCSSGLPWSPYFFCFANHYDHKNTATKIYNKNTTIPPQKHHHTTAKTSPEKNHHTIRKSLHKNTTKNSTTPPQSTRFAYFHSVVKRRTVGICQSSGYSLTVQSLRFLEVFKKKATTFQLCY